MTWQQLGTVNLSYDWQFLAVPVIKFGLFRITQNYSDTEYIHGKIIVGQAFNEPKEFYTYRAIYPSKKQKIISLLTPNELIRAEGIFSKYLAVKFDKRYYRYSVGWNIGFEVQDVVSLDLDQVHSLQIENRENAALLQQQLSRVEQKVDTLYVE